LAELVASARFARRGADPAPPGTVDHGQGLGERSRRRTAAVITYVDTSTPLKLSIDEVAPAAPNRRFSSMTSPR
jgi:hypothetical protein